MYYGHTSNLDSGLFTKKGTNLQDNISRKKTIQNMSEFLPLEIIAPFIPVKIENRTCEIASAALGTLFLCCVRVVNQNTRALLLLVFYYSCAT